MHLQYHHLLISARAVLRRRPIFCFSASLSAVSLALSPRILARFLARLQNHENWKIMYDMLHTFKDRIHQPDFPLSLLSSALLFCFVLLPRTYALIEIVKHILIPTRGPRVLAVAAGRHGGRGEHSQVPEVEASFAFLYLQSGANQMTEA